MQIFNIQEFEKLHAAKLQKRNKCVLCSCIRDEKTYYCIECSIYLFVKIFGAILLKIAATYKNSSKLHRYLKGYMYNIE